MLQQTHYPNVIEIPTDFFDVNSVVKRQPTTTHETTIRLRILQKDSQKPRVTMTHLFAQVYVHWHICMTDVYYMTQYYSTICIFAPVTKSNIKITQRIRSRWQGQFCKYTMASQFTCMITIICKQVWMTIGQHEQIWWLQVM